MHGHVGTQPLSHLDGSGTHTNRVFHSTTFIQLHLISIVWLEAFSCVQYSRTRHAVLPTIKKYNYATLDSTTPQTVWVAAAVVVGQSQVILNLRTFAMIGWEQNHTNTHVFLVLGTKRINCRRYLTGEVSALLGTGLLYSNNSSLINDVVLFWICTSNTHTMKSTNLN